MECGGLSGMSGYVRLSGIERDVYLYSTPKQYIADYKLNASLDKEKYKDGIFGLEVTVEGPSITLGATSIAYTLKDAEGKAVLQDAIRIKSRGLSNLITFDRKNLPDVKAWSAEHPHLYTLILELKDEQGKVTELTGCESASVPRKSKTDVSASTVFRYW